MQAIDEAIRGPKSAQSDGTMRDGFDDWLYWTWPRRDGPPRPQYIIGTDSRTYEEEPFAMLVWKSHRSSPSSVVESASGILAGNRVTYHLD